VKRKITVIMAADVVGFSRLVAEDEEETLRRLASYRDVFSDFITRAGGRIFNTAGDSILAEFQSAVDAVRCAVDVQESIRTRNLAYRESRHMNFRIGITIGDVVERDGDLLGDGVNIAARLESVSPPGGVCISRSVHEAVANKVTVKFSDMGHRQLKNIPEPVHAYAIGAVPDAKPGWHFPSLGSALPQSWRLRGASIAQSRAGWAAAAAIVIGASAMLYFAVGPSRDDGAHLSREENASAAPAEEKSAAAPKAPHADSTPLEKVAAKDETPAEPVAAKPAAVPAQAADKSAAASPAATSEGEQAGERKAIDPLALAILLPRQMRECRDGTSEQARTACQAIVDNRLVTGSELATVQLKLGKSLREAGEVDRAIAAFSGSIGAAPSADAYNNRGIAYYEKGERERAIADYSEAVRLEPQHGEAFNNRAWTYFKSGQAQTALADADQAVRLLPGQAYTWDTRAHVREALGERDAAIRDYRKALELDPASNASRNGLQRLGAAP
jgi:class 3 adenylate cyclase/tetratricopeptide (TPR) repeat protein